MDRDPPVQTSFLTDEVRIYPGDDTVSILFITPDRTQSFITKVSIGTPLGDALSDVAQRLTPQDDESGGS